MAAPPPDSALPPWAVDALVWIALAILGLFTGIIGWFTRKYITLVDSHAKLIGSMSATYATIEMVNDMEDKIPELVTRTELVSYMRQMKEDAEDRREQDRQEALRMHKENLDNGMATRTDIRAVHERVDALFRNGHAR
jgi:hypothetical protein